MSRISIKDAVKRYGNNTVIPDLTLEIGDGELFTLLGPSGCGKTTLLRMIAGFNSIEGGDVCFNEKRINDMDPSKRNIGMVFQNYAIFPHLTVEENVAYGLKAKKVPRDEIRRRVKDALELVQIENLATRKPNELSGGQQQRVALARAFVIEPALLLMDEPLSNLDAKLRVQMRTIIKKLQRKLGITTIYVTHDQEEALAISDRIAVMQSGNIMQVGTPEQIYKKPDNPFVAGFIGVSNFLDCELAADGAHLAPEYTIQPPLRREYAGKALLSARPEQLFFDEERGIEGEVGLSLFLGDFVEYEIKLHTGQTIQLNEYTKDVNEVRPVGQRVRVCMDPARISLYVPDTGEVLSC